MIPLLDCSPNARFPINGGLVQRRGGTARHDAVAWGFARGADARGVDIIQNCEVTGIRRDGARVAGVETTRGYIGAKKVGIAVAGNSSRLAAMAGIRLPMESHVLQAAVTEPLKPAIHTVVTSGAAHVYISQTDKGEILMGGSLDFYNSYAQRGEPAGAGARHPGCDLALPLPEPAEAHADLGRGDGHDHGRQPDPRKASRRGPVHRTAAGATAASRRRRGRAGAMPGPSPTTSRIRSTRRSGSTASTEARSSTRRAPGPARRRIDRIPPGAASMYRERPT